ncbi:stage II sporulation protein M [Novosphingopyxis sp.]|uniref:stage II sporulation protein M n=1 Tax=Novosphingopyxis sp. TaxID=2709690 RepID=UPI003B5AC30C
MSSAAPIQSAANFRAEREEDWAAFEALLGRLDKRGPKRLSEDELLQLPRLYRGTLSSLSLARAISLDQALIAHLEALSLRGYYRLYGNRAGLTGRVARFFLADWPAAVRALWRETLAMLALLLLGVGVGWALVASDPSWYAAFVPPELAQGRGPEVAAGPLREILFGGGGDGFLTGFAVQLFVHNSQVAILCFALGFAFGLPTILLVLYHGCMVGALLQIYAAKGLGVELGGWLFIHGTTELFAIVLAAAAGIRIGSAVAFPGDRARIDAAAEAGRSAATAMVGVVVMLLVAGLLEGIGRQTITVTAARYAIGAFMLAGWCSYFYLLRPKSRFDGD